MKLEVTKKEEIKILDENEKEIEDSIVRIAGEEGKQLFLLLKLKENISEFLLAEKLNLTINQVRNILYKFDKYGLVSSTRKKDRKKGWYVYYWTFNPYKAEDLMITIKKNKLNKSKILLEREKNNHYYTCPKGCMRLNFEMALENQFQCLECGQLMQPEDSEKNIAKLKKDILSLEEEIKKLTEKRDKRVFEEPEEKKKPKKKKPIKKSKKKKIQPKKKTKKPQKKHLIKKSKKKKTPTKKKIKKPKKKSKKKKSVKKSKKKKIQPKKKTKKLQKKIKKKQSKKKPVKKSKKKLKKSK